VMATVLALVAGGLRIVTRAMERMMARRIRAICRMWTRSLRVSSKERSEDESECIVVDGCGCCVFLFGLVCGRWEGDVWQLCARSGKVGSGFG